MQLDLTGHHALVGGASRGIGRAAAVELARLGADVTLLARSADALQAALQVLPKIHAGQRHAWRSVDMADTEALQAAVAAVAAEQPATILVNNSGGPPGGPIREAEPHAFEAAFRQHLIAAQVTVHALLPGMRERGYGRIVNVISTSVKEPLPGLGVSNTVRAAMAGWAKTLSGELAADGITVNNVLPGYTNTGRMDSLREALSRSSGRSVEEIAKSQRAAIPAGRFGEPEEIAAMIAFLCTPAAAYVTGTSIAVDGGRTHALS